jgi:hypothetical protein
MTVGTPRKALLDLTLCPVRTSGAGDDDVRVYVLLPTVDELLGRPGFGRRDPIFLPGHRRPLDGWAIFGAVRGRDPLPH